MSRRTDIIITAIVFISLALVVASVVAEAMGSGVHLAACACWTALMALFVLVYARGRR